MNKKAAIVSTVVTINLIGLAFLIALLGKPVIIGTLILFLAVFIWYVIYTILS